MRANRLGDDNPLQPRPSRSSVDSLIEKFSVLGARALGEADLLRLSEQSPHTADGGHWFLVAAVVLCGSYLPP